MAVSVSRPTMEHINTVLRKPASTLLWSERPKEFFPNNFLVGKVGLQFHCAKHPAWLERCELLQVPGANIPWIGCCHQLAVWLRLCSVCLIGGRQSRHRVDDHSDDWIDALLREFPATGHLKRVEDVHAEMLQPLLRQFCFCAKKPHNLSRLAHKITNLPEIRNAFTQVVG